MSTKASDQIWQILATLTFVFLLIFGPLRILLFTGLSRLASLESPTALQRSYYASWAVLVYTIFPVAVLWAITLILSNANLLPGRIELLNQSSFFCAVHRLPFLWPCPCHVGPGQTELPPAQSGDR